MAGLDGILNHIEPPEPVDKDLYELPPEEHAGIKQVPIGLKRDEIDQARLSPTPLEYELYFHI